MNPQQLEKTLQSYTPPNTAKKLAEWIVQYKVSVKLTRERKSKLGDYRPPHGRYGHRISVNHNLNPYQFLITFVHEMAHLVTWERYQNKVSPHGKEWKNTYKKMLGLFVGKDIFPPEVEEGVKQHLASPAASSCRDEQLYKLLKNYDVNPSGNAGKWLYLEEIPQNTLFKMEDGRMFRKGQKLRKYYRCVDVENQRLYRISGIAMVRPLIERQ